MWFDISHKPHSMYLIFHITLHNIFTMCSPHTYLSTDPAIYSSVHLDYCGEPTGYTLGTFLKEFSTGGPGIIQDTSHNSSHFPMYFSLTCHDFCCFPPFSFH